MLPTIAEYRALRERYPDTFLFFHWKTGYWLFHEQAYIATRVLFPSHRGYIMLSGPGWSERRVRALPINPSHLGRIVAELKLVCFGMRVLVIDE
jgi:hypothetical protein